MRDDTKEMSFGIALVDDLIGAGVGGLTATAVMLSINPWVTLGTFLPLVIVVFIAHRLGNYARKFRAVGRQTTSNVTGLIADMFNGTETVKAAGAEERLIAHFREVNEQRKTAMIKDKLMTEFVDVLSGGTADIGIGLVLLLAAQAMYNGSFTVGDFALFASYVWPMTHMMKIAAGLITRYRQVDVSTVRMDEMMQGLPAGAAVEHQRVYLREEPPELRFAPKTTADELHTLTVSNLSYTYPYSENGIAEINLQLQRGSFTVITGRIGSGKTTLLKVLLGLLPGDGGEILWNGQLVDKPTASADSPRDCQSYLAAAFWDGSGGHAQRFGVHGGSSHASRVAGLAGDPVCGGRLVHQEVTSLDRAFGNVSAGLARGTRIISGRGRGERKCTALAPKHEATRCRDNTRQPTFGFGTATG